MSSQLWDSALSGEHNITQYYCRLPSFTRQSFCIFLSASSWMVLSPLIHSDSSLMRATYLIRDFCCLVRDESGETGEPCMTSASCVVSASGAFTFSNLHVHMSGDWQFCVCQESVRLQLFVGTTIYNTPLYRAWDVKFIACWMNILRNNKAHSCPCVADLKVIGLCLQFPQKCQDKWQPEPGAGPGDELMGLWADPRPRVISASASKPQHSLAEIFISFTLCK